MGSKGKNNQHFGGTSAQGLDQWAPLTPTKPDLLLGDSAQSPMNPTGGRIHGSKCCHVHTGNVDIMNVSNEVNDVTGEGFLQLLQPNPAQFVNDSNFPYSAMLNSQKFGFNQQLMYMADSMTLKYGLAGMNSFCQDSFEASSSMHTDVQTLRNDHYQVSPFAPATPDLRAMQNMFVIDPANACIDGQGNCCENDISDQIHFSLEGDSAISPDQVYHLNQKNASICQLVHSNMEKSSVKSQKSILTASPTSIQPDTPLKGSHVHEGDEAFQTIDLNESPSHKPKRKKHRPKVVREAKGKKTQGPVTPQQPPREKRKYVRKSTPKGLTTTPPECGISPSESFTRSGGKKASCRRALNFNSPDCQYHGSIINGGSCISVVDNGSDPQPKGNCEKAYLQPKPGEGLVIDLNYSQMPTKDFQPENFTPLNMIVRTEPMQENMKHLARRINSEHHVIRVKTKSLKDLSADSGINEIGLKRGFYGNDAMNDNSLNPTNCKKSKPYLFQKGVSRNDPSTDSTTESNGYCSPVQDRSIDARIEHNRKISNLTCNGSSLCSTFQRTSVHDLSSSMQFVPSEGSGDFPAHFAHSPKIAHGINSCQATSEILRMDPESQNAIVLYGGNKQIVAYEGPVIKKKPPRAKVELDGETLRVWDMLMWKQGDDTEEKQDSKKEWWAEQRRVFKGRVDSFIARMHLIQGDRRFSKWKGSVLDSVVGVFLTQNVSDHLSSSAFMSLASKFPLHPQRSFNDMHHGEAKRDSSVGSERKETACEQGMSSELLESSFREIFQIPGDGKRTFLNEEAGLCHEKGHRDEVDWVGSSQFSTPSDKDEPKVLKDFLDARGFVENTTAKNHVWQPVPEDASDLLQVEDVVTSQNSVVSSLSSTGPYLQLFYEACFNAPYTSFSKLLQMQYELGQKLCSNSEAMADQPIKENNGTTYERWSINSHEDVEESSPYICDRNSYSSSLKETTRPDWRSSEWTYVPEDETKSHLHPPISNDAGFNCPDYPGLSQESMHPSSKYATSLPFSAAYCSSVDNPSIQTSGDVVQPSFEYDMWSAARLQHRVESESHSDTLESMEGSSCVNNMYSVKTRAAQPESSVQLIAGKHASERQEQLSLPANQKWVDSVRGEKAAESAIIGSNSAEKVPSSSQNYDRDTRITSSKPDTNTKKSKNEKKKDVDWDSLRKEALKHQKGPRSPDTMDSLDYEALRCADVREVSDAIKERGMNNRLAQRIQDFLNRLMQDHGSLDLEWLRDVPPDKAKEYLLSINGLGLKSVECVRLLTLLQLAFPVDTNVGRIAVRLGWVPLQPLPESLQLHLLELYPILESVQKYLWPRLCTLAQTTLYELHYQMITFGKVFCTKNKPNCNACPLRAECKHFASAFASARLALPGPEDKSVTLSSVPHATSSEYHMPTNSLPLPAPSSHLESELNVKMSGPIIEEPLSPEPEVDISQDDIEEAFWENDIEDIPTLRLNVEQFSRNLKNFVLENMAEFNDVDMSKALVALSEEAGSIPTQKMKSISRLRTEHQVYQLPDNHVLLLGLELRETDDPSPYLLAIWAPGETANSVEPPEMSCGSQESGSLCNQDACFSCNSRREAYTQTVRGTFLIPCRTATRGSFPLNGTYFQVNEIFADHVTSLEPINVPRALIWNLPRSTVYFGTSVPTIFRGQTLDAIRNCFQTGYVCVRGFDRNTRAPRPLMARLHLSASKVLKTNKEEKKPGQRN